MTDCWPMRSSSSLGPAARKGREQTVTPVMRSIDRRSGCRRASEAARRSPRVTQPGSAPAASMAPAPSSTRRRSRRLLIAILRQGSEGVFDLAVVVATVDAQGIVQLPQRNVAEGGDLLVPVVLVGIDVPVEQVLRAERELQRTGRLPSDVEVGGGHDTGLVHIRLTRVRRVYDLFLIAIEDFAQ